MLPTKRAISPAFRPLIAAIAAFLFACSGSGRAPGDGERATAPEAATARPQAASLAPPTALEPARANPAQMEPAGAIPESAPGEAPPEPTDSEAPADEAPPRPRREPSGARVYSNEDLKKYAHLKEQFGFREGTVVADLSAQQPKHVGPEAEPEPVPMTREEWDREYRATFKEVERLTGELKYLEARAASLHNPFLPRAKQSEADQLAESGMDSKERLARVNELIARTQRDLDAAKRHFAQIQENVPPEPASADR